MAIVESTISPPEPIAAPASPVPAPRVTTGVRVCVAMRITAWTSSMVRGVTTAAGGAAER